MLRFPRPTRIFLVLGVGIIAMRFAPPSLAENATQPATATRPAPTVIPRQELPKEALQKIELLEKEGVKVHGLQRGEPLDNGWARFTSTGAGFSIELPWPVVDLQIPANTRDKDEVVTDALGVGTTDTKFAVTRMQRTDKRVERTLEDFEKQWKGRPDTRDFKEVTVDGQKGFEARLETSRSHARMRFFQTDGAIYLCVAEYPPAKEKEITPVVDRFMDSLVFPKGQ